MAPEPSPARPSSQEGGEADDVVANLPTAALRTATNPTQPPRRRQKQLSTDSLNWGMPSNANVNLHVQEETGDDSWQYKVVKLLHGRRMQMFLAGLLLLDVVILFCELALLTLFPSCYLVERDAISCCPGTSSTVTGEEQLDGAQRWLAGSDGAHYSCAPGLEPSKDYEATCDSHKWHTVHTVEMVLISVTITILSIFFLELTILVMAVGPGIFFRQVFYALDYFIVAVSLGLEVTFVSLGNEITASLVGLVILGRLWRFVRIGHGIVELTDELAHEKHVQELVYTRELEFLLEQHGIPLPTILPGGNSGHSGGHCELVERVEKKQISKRRATYHENMLRSMSS